MRDSMAILHMLCERGFIPQDEQGIGGADWFDFLTRPSGRSVRVEIDAAGLKVHVLTASQVCEWTSALTDAAPLSVITTTVGLAIADAVTGAR